MIPGFRAGGDDFAGARASWQLPDAPGLLGRVFPGGQPFDRGASPERLAGLVKAKCDRVLAAGMIPFPSIKPQPVDLLAGKLDRHIDAVADYLASLPEGAYASIWHEGQKPNKIPGVKDSPLLQARLWNKTYTYAYKRIKARAGDRIQVGPVDMEYHFAPGQRMTEGAALDAWRVPPDLRDFAGLDAYANVADHPDRGALEVQPGYRRWREWLADDSAILLVERGIAGNSAGGPRWQADVLAADLRHLETIGARGLLYWHSDGAPDKVSDYHLTEPAVEVFREAVAATIRPHPEYMRGFAEGQAAAFAELGAYATQRAKAGSD